MIWGGTQFLTPGHWNQCCDNPQTPRNSLMAEWWPYQARCALQQIHHLSPPSLSWQTPLRCPVMVFATTIQNKQHVATGEARNERYNANKYEMKNKDDNQDKHQCKDNDNKKKSERRDNKYGVSTVKRFGLKLLISMSSRLRRPTLSIKVSPSISSHGMPANM